MIASRRDAQHVRPEDCRYCLQPHCRHDPETGRCPGPYAPRFHYMPLKPQGDHR